MPDNRWYFDNARVGQKLLQVALHRRWLGRIGRAQIDEQQAGSRWRRMIFGKVRHVYRSANKGKVRKRSPVTVKSAFAMAGATGGTAISPMPPGSSLLRMNSTVTSPMSARRNRPSSPSRIEIGRASCLERVSKHVSISVSAVP